MRRCLSVSLALSLVIGVLGVTSATAAGASRSLPHRFNPQSLDGPLVNLVNPVDGRTWSAWAYRNGAEYDIAVSYLDDGGYWSEPTFLGRADRHDQVQPALATDASGHLYLAFADRATGAVMLSALAAGSDSWSEPIRISDPGTRGSMPALRVVGGRLAVAYRSGTSIEIRDLPLLPAPTGGFGITDGPDPFGSNGEDSGGSGGDTPRPTHWTPAGRK